MRTKQSKIFKVTALSSLMLGMPACDDSNGGSSVPTDEASSTRMESSGASMTSSDTAAEGSMTSSDVSEESSGMSLTSTGSSGESSGSDDTTGGQPDPEAQLPPEDTDELTAWLEAGSYATWLAESGIHDSAGPHGRVRTFFNDALGQAFTGGSSTHPIGSASVKEIYNNDDTLIGWAVMAKDPGNDGAWRWFEVLNGSLIVNGTSVALCQNCHGSGTDQVLTSYPLQ